MGASGGIGQPLALLLKQSPLVSELSLYDIVNTPGVAADLSHIETRSKVTGYTGPNELEVNYLLFHSFHLCKFFFYYELLFFFVGIIEGCTGCHYSCRSTKETWNDTR